MYKTILVTLEASPTDNAIVKHIKILAKEMQSSVVLLHIATGVPAQYHGPNAGGQEIWQDEAYLQVVKAEFESAGIPTVVELGYGDPAREIVRWVHENTCDLVAMSTHGHEFVADLLFGATASRVQHRIGVPVLLLRAK